MDFSKLTATLKILGKAELGAPLVIVIILAMIMLPLPAFLLDLLFTFNIAFSLIILLVVVYTLKPLEFAAFPTVILLATLLRLALNVASTRIVLLEGHNGGDAAGSLRKFPSRTERRLAFVHKVVLRLLASLYYACS